MRFEKAYGLRLCCRDQGLLDIERVFPFRILTMPHKFNASCRHKIARQKYRVTNGATYNESLRRRGDLTVWVSDEVLRLWSAPRRTTRGGQRKYSDLAIELCLTLGVVFKQPLRQTQGFMRSITEPDFSTLSRRCKELKLPAMRKPDSCARVHLVVDSTGLKILGESEWLEQKHKTRAKRKRWRKLCLGLDLVSGEIVCAELTTDDVGDPTALPSLLNQINNPGDRFLADGAYDGGTRTSRVRARGLTNRMGKARSAQGLIRATRPSITNFPSFVVITKWGMRYSQVNFDPLFK
jgi:hypothetical protein